MSDIQKLLERQAEWQKSWKSLSWPEKVRMAEEIRDSVLQFRRAAYSTKRFGVRMAKEVPMTPDLSKLSKVRR